MTLKEAINTCDGLRVNDYAEAEKIAWLSNLDGMIKKEIIDCHEGSQQVTFSGYTAETPDNTELLVPEPYSDLYIKYLFAQIDFNNAEFTRYNNSMVMFNYAYQQYADAYNRNHMPLQRNSFRV